jgi:cytochrome c553
VREACHGKTAEANKALAPRLAGQPAGIRRELGNFKQGLRGADS